MALGIENLTVAVAKDKALPTEIADVLQLGGISTLEQLGRTSAAELKNIGINKEEAAKLLTAMSAFKIIVPSFKVEDFSE
jgi:hypothetical protein